MVSISSAKKIKERAGAFFKSEITIEAFDQNQVKRIKKFLKNEYNLIPDKERIGKGMVYITKHVSKKLYQYLKEIQYKEKNEQKFIDLIFSIIELFEKAKDHDLLRFGIHFASNFSLDYFNTLISKIKSWANNGHWEIRENAQYPMLAGLKKFRNDALEILDKWAESGNKNIRRFVAESLRPKTMVKWLRDPKENDQVLSILTKLRFDDSIYVRKAVGNNLKDLSKYMPEKILNLIDEWLKEKDNLNEKEQNNLMWIVYQALRWLKKKETKYHAQIEEMVGKNYLLYFDEKRNRWAKPPKK
ncbi:MAG: hypothetical protein EU550_03620 [Promethearchaeota archaeon]|nr:MAG: hypothetical protein EU550_03620 [Candidatus Lokiarchaeota archaeon]